MTDFDTAELREQLREEDEVKLPPWTGRVPAAMAKNLAFRARAWERAGNEGSFANSKRVQDAISIAGSERVTEAIDNGNRTPVTFEAGMADRSLDAGYVVALAEYWTVLKHVGRIGVLTGSTNSGKTNVGLLGADLTYRLADTGMDEPNPMVVSNIPRDDLDAPWLEDYREVASISELREVLEENSKRRKLVVVDDASIDHAEGTSNSHQVREEMGEVVRLAAKLHSVVLFLSHREDGYGVAKHLREMPGTVQLHCEREFDERGDIEEYRVEVRDGVGEDATTVQSLGELPKADAEYEPDAVANPLFGD